MTIFISSHILSEVARLATRIGVIHEGRLVKELYTKELTQQEEKHLIVDVCEMEAALMALGRAGIVARPDNKNSLVIMDKTMVQNPDKVATLLVQAGFPPTRLVVEQEDLEAYFLNLVGLKEREK